MRISHSRSKSLDDLGVGEGFGRDELQKVVAARLDVLDFVRAGIAAAGHDFENLVVAERAAGHKTCRRCLAERYGATEGRLGNGGPLFVAQRCFERRGRLGRPQDGVVCRAAPRIEQHQPGAGHLVEQPLRMGLVRAGLQAAQMGHALVGRRLNDVCIRLERRKPQQPVMTGGLLDGRNSHPLMIGIKAVAHGICTCEEENRTCKFSRAGGALATKNGGEWSCSLAMESYLTNGPGATSGSPGYADV